MRNQRRENLNRKSTSDKISYVYCIQQLHGIHTNKAIIKLFDDGYSLREISRILRLKIDHVRDEVFAVLRRTA